MHPDLTLRSNYFTDPLAFKGLVDLLFDTFGIDIGILDRFGGPNPTSMPFGYFDQSGRCVANFSAFSIPLMIDGEIVRAIGYQSGAVRPEYRGQGLYRDLMERAFEWASGQGAQLGILLTDKPALYAPYGFRSAAQHLFTGPPPPAMPSTGVARSLSMNEADDAALVLALLKQRNPVSKTFAVTNQATEFPLNACFAPGIRLSHLPHEDVVIAWKMADGTTFQLLDIVARDMPSLTAILAALDIHPARVEVFFPTDHIGWTGVAEDYRGLCDLMIAGKHPWLTAPPPFMLSPMADF